MATLTTGLRESLAPETIRGLSQTSLYARWGKRLFDITAAAAGLMILSPLLILCSLVVWLTSEGPVLFYQRRVGYRGRLFRILKFRTMVQGAEALGPTVVVANDRRLTPVGSFLRRAKLDELPQLFNVLLGEMSLVGPRPRVPSEVNFDDPGEQVLWSARPGVTSYASIHHHMEADYCAGQPDPQKAYRTKVLPQKRLLDGKYVQNLTFLLDLKLLALTFLLVFLPGRSPSRRQHVLGREVWPEGRVAQMGLDVFISMAAAWLAYTLWFEAGMPEFYRRQMLLFVVVVPLVRVMVHRALGVYDMMWRYINLEDGLLLALAFAPVTVALFALRMCLPTSSRVAVAFLVPLGVIALEYLCTLAGALGLRCLRRLLYVLHHHCQPLPEAEHHVLILGAGLMGLSTAMDMRRYPQMHLVGFVDDDPMKNRRLMAGYRVLGNSADLPSLCARHQITDVIICAKLLGPNEAEALHRRCSWQDVRFHLLPSLDRVLHEEGLDPQAPLAIAVEGGA